MKTQKEEIALWRDYVKVLYAMIRGKEYAFRTTRDCEVTNGRSEAIFKVSVASYGYAKYLTDWEMGQKLEGVDFVYLTQNEYEEYGVDTEYDFSKKSNIGVFKSYDEKNGILRLSVDEKIKEEKFEKDGYLLPNYWLEKRIIGRMSKAIGQLKDPKKNGYPVNKALADYLFNPKDLTSSGYGELSEFHHSFLNDAQRDAVKMVMCADGLSIIQGPPGTGKTTVIGEIVFQELAKNPDARILIASQCNYAVDNAIELFRDMDDVFPIRIGCESRITNWGKFFYDNALRNWGNTKNAVKRLADDVGKRSKSERVMEAIEECGDDVRDIFYKAYLRSVSVWVSTCSSCTGTRFRELYEQRYGKLEKKENPWFDIVIVDEASKATPPELIMPLTLGKKMVLIGDHKQLAPMYQEQDIEEFLEESKEIKGLMENGLRERIEESIKHPLFEEIYEAAPDKCKAFLDTQYRSHSIICNCYNSFYDGKLKCGEDVDEKRVHHIKWDDIITPKDHAIWFDVKGKMQNSKSPSNETEVKAVKRIVEKIKECGMSVGVITFYRSQMRNLKRELKDYKDVAEVATVDRFQGMEKDVIILSTVRSGNCGLGFAKDPRRINVAMSRAKSLLVVVGDRDLFSQDEVYKNAIKGMKVVNSSLAS